MRNLIQAIYRCKQINHIQIIFDISDVLWQRDKNQSAYFMITIRKWNKFKTFLLNYVGCERRKKKTILVTSIA